MTDSFNMAYHTKAGVEPWAKIADSMLRKP